MPEPTISDLSDEADARRKAAIGTFEAAGIKVVTVGDDSPEAASVRRRIVGDLLRLSGRQMRPETHQMLFGCPPDPPLPPRVKKNR